MIYYLKVTEKNIEKRCVTTTKSDQATETLSELVNGLQEGETLSEIVESGRDVWLTSQCRCEKGGYIRWIHTSDDDAKPFTTNQYVENFPKAGIKQSLHVRPQGLCGEFQITKMVNGTTLSTWDTIEKSDLDYLIDNDVNVTIQPRKRG